MIAALLHTLPPEHPARNAPLAGCYYRWQHAKKWQVVKPVFGIAGNTFNELGPAWTDNDVFCWSPEQ